ncbi:MAG: beta-lactamase family protein [Acidimicrobiales bacterium]|jgi:CubicO group peptidase (beta-lactamase class C family)|nr:beta-lactamase family protein [Acidimicrobiales bacterium]
MTTVPHLQGDVAAGFEGVRDAFAANFAEQGEIGAAVAAWVDGRPVVSLWGGVADPTTGRPWDRDTVVVVFSMTKGLTATAVHHLAERGGIDLDAPVCTYWPAFAANGKDTVTVRMLLAHQAGLPVVEGAFTLDEALSWDPVVTALAAQTPVWEPGAAHGYHVRTFGWLVGEVFRRASGRTVGCYVADELTGPLGCDWWLGLPAEHEPRVARLVPPPPQFQELLDSLGDLLFTRAMSTPANLFRYDEMWNDRRIRAVELPSSNSITNAASVARFYAALLGPVDGVQLLAPDTVAAATRVQSDGPDLVLLIDSRFATGYMLGRMLASPAGPRAFGHTGAGGSTAFVDPDRGLAFAYTTNTMRFDTQHDVRSERLARALYDAVPRGC